MTTFAVTEILNIIDAARDAELCRDLERSEGILAEVWPDISIDPDFSDFDRAVAAELYRLCGYFLSSYGRARVLSNFQSRGKDLATKAIGIFKQVGMPDKIAEARVTLALCYHHVGEFSECALILDTAEAQFDGNILHPVYLQIVTNRIGVYYSERDYESALRRIREIESIADLSTDDRLLTMFHNQAGIVYRAVGNPDKSVFHLSEAIRCGKRAKNLRFVAINCNNLAMVYKDLKMFSQAHEQLDDAKTTFLSLNEAGRIPQILDTRALIYLDEGRSLDALSAINEAIRLFSQGEDHGGRADAYWTKCKCLMRLNEPYEDVFAELLQIADTHLGGSERYLDLLNQEREVLAPAVKTIYHGIRRIEMPANARYSFEAAVAEYANLSFYFCSKASRVIAVKAVSHISEGAAILFVYDGANRIGQVWREEMSDLLAVNIADEDYTLLDDVKAVGMPIGWCDVDDLAEQPIRFKKF